VIHARPLQALHRGVTRQRNAFRGGLDAHNGERVAVARRVDRGGYPIAAAYAFILSRHIQQQRVKAAGQGPGFSAFSTAQARQAVGREHAAFAVHLFGVVLRAHGGVRPAQAFHCFFHVAAVGGDFGGHIISGKPEDAPQAIALFSLAGAAQLLRQQRAAGPGGAPEDARGVGGSAHRRHVFFIFDAQHVLGFIHFQ